MDRLQIWTPLFLVLVTHQDMILSVIAQSFNFPSFNSTEKLLINPDAQHMPNTSSIWLQPAYKGSADGNSYACGDVIYEDTIQMRNASSAVASFNTSFTFSMTGRNSAGMTFMFIATNRTTGSPGGSLCLLRKPRNGDAANHVFAVEFDTWKNPEFDDPSNNHVGVNVNSMNSIAVHNLCGMASTCNYLVVGEAFTAWIDYDSTTQALAVYFTKGALSEGISKPATPIIQVPILNLTAVFNDYMHVGFSGSGAMYSEVKKIKSWSFQTGTFGYGSTIIPVIPQSSRQRKFSVGVEVIAAAVAAGCGLLVAIFCAFLACWRRRQVAKACGSGDSQANNMDNQMMWPREFSFQELNAATNGFSEECLLGEGGFGQVFRGTLKSPGRGQVAVKRTKMESATQEFLSELSVISQIRHRNLIRLYGWCQENNHLLLVFEYMPNSSLERWLFDNKKRPHQGKLLTWPQRQHIMTGVAAALTYLHEGWSQCILHRDIKAANVLLDEDFNPHVGDFGLARLISHTKQGCTTAVAGTFGYLAPETAQEGKVTPKSDVYSFGILALEVASGLPVLRMNRSADENVCTDDAEPVNLLENVWLAHERGEVLSAVDPRLLESECDPEQVKLMFQLGLLCCHPDPDARPVMRVVHRYMVDGEVARLVASLPPSKPRVQYHYVGVVNSSYYPREE